MLNEEKVSPKILAYDLTQIKCILEIDSTKPAVAKSILGDLLVVGHVCRHMHVLKGFEFDVR
jgi:hypothetical protein